jgi:hypothetical protein
MTPDGDQVEIVEVMEIAHRLISHHRILLGLEGQPPHRAKADQALTPGAFLSWRRRSRVEPVRFTRCRPPPDGGRLLNRCGCQAPVTILGAS